MSKFITTCLVSGVCAISSVITRAGLSESTLADGSILSVTFPMGWSSRESPAGAHGLSIKAAPNASVAMKLKVTVVETGDDPPITLEQLLDQLNRLAQPYLKNSAEGKFSPQEITMRQGRGWYVQLTDASLTGKEPVPDDYKITRIGLISLDDHAMALALVQFDDPAAKQVAESLELLASLKITRGAKPLILAQAIILGDFKFTMAPSKLRLRIPAAGMEEASAYNPQYFRLTRISPDLTVSGWFEPGEKYQGMEKFCAGESEKLSQRGLPNADNVAFLQAGDWDLVAYDFKLEKGISTNVRAERVRAGTWVDLHLSSATKPSEATAAREAMLSFLKGIELSEK